MSRGGQNGCQATYLPWTAAERDALFEAWPRGGIKAARVVLPGRSDDSLKGKADALNLVIVGRKKYTRYEPSEFIDAAIKRAYLQGRPDLPALEKATGRPKGWLKYRAGVMGLRSQAVGRPECAWLAAEDAMIVAGQDQGLTVTTIHKRLRNAGHQRSLNAVSCRIQNLGLCFNRSWWTASQVAALLGMDVNSILRWIEKGWLTGTRKAGPSALVEPEERRKMWAISQQAVRDFMLRYPEKWDHRKVRKEVLLDLLCPERFNTMALKEAG